MMCKKIRPLRADEIEVRVSQCSEKGAQVLLYKDARCDRRVLDEVFGPLGWQNDFYMLDDVLYCKISVYDKESNQWITKSDCGTESNTEKEKGRASDAFKRAGFSWGIGRELYTKLFIFLKVPTKCTGKDARGKDRWEMADRYAKFTVKEMDVDEEREKITRLVIVDKNDDVVYTYNEKKSNATAHKTSRKEPLPMPNIMLPPDAFREAEPIATPAEEDVVCNYCGKTIESRESKKLGIVISAKEVKEKCGGLCVDCYKGKENLKQWQVLIR